MKFKKINRKNPKIQQHQDFKRKTAEFVFFQGDKEDSVYEGQILCLDKRFVLSLEGTPVSGRHYTITGLAIPDIVNTWVGQGICREDGTTVMAQWHYVGRNRGHQYEGSWIEGERYNFKIINEE